MCVCAFMATHTYTNKISAASRPKQLAFPTSDLLRINKHLSASLANQQYGGGVCLVETQPDVNKIMNFV